METRYLYWSFNLEIMSYSLIGSTVRVYRKEKDWDCDIYITCDERIKAMRLINGERSWTEVLDLWMEGRTDSRKEAEAELKEIIKGLKCEYEIELYGKHKKVKKEVKVFRRENGKDTIPEW